MGTPKLSFMGGINFCLGVSTPVNILAAFSVNVSNS